MPEDPPFPWSRRRAMVGFDCVCRLLYFLAPASSGTRQLPKKQDSVMRAIFLLSLSLLAVSCGDTQDDHSGCNHAHLPKGPNGLDLLDLGPGKGAVEFGFHKEHLTCSVYLLDDARALKGITEKPQLRVQHGKDTVEIAGTSHNQDGSLWVFEHASLKQDPDKAFLILSRGELPETIELPIHHHH